MPKFCTDNYVEQHFQMIQLDGNVTPHIGVKDLKDRGKLSQYLNHCFR